MALAGQTEALAGPPGPALSGPTDAALARLEAHQQGLLAIADLMGTRAPLDELIRQVLELLQRTVAYDLGAFYWWDAGRRALRRAAVVRTNEAAAAVGANDGEHVVGADAAAPGSNHADAEADAPLEVAIGDEAALLAEAVARRAPRLRSGGLAETSEIAVPLLIRGTLLGAVSLKRHARPSSSTSSTTSRSFGTSTGWSFSDADLAFATQFARQASVAIENARLLRQLGQSEEQYRSLFDACLDVVYMSTPSGLFLDINPAGLALFGHAAHEDLLLVDIAHDLFEDPHDRDEFKRLIAEHGFVRDREARLKRADGQVLTVIETATAVRDESGNVIAYRGILRDITERKRAEQALAHQALHDALTGLPNRTLLQDRVHQAIQSATRHGSSAALLLMDLDRFKEVNDTLGHVVGDQLLVEVARRLQAAVRPGDTVARLGGDEFAVVLPEADADGARMAALRILASVERPLVLGQHGMDMYVRGSIGVAIFPEHGGEPDQLLQRADVAMYMAKHGGGGCAIYASDQDQHSPSRLALAGELRNSLEQGKLVLQYQPQIALATDRLIGVEALARWPHPRRGPIAPDTFIPLAEQAGLIRPLTDWMLTTALRDCQAWQASGVQLPVSVNLSMRDLQDARLPDVLARMLARHLLQPSWLRLEITESVLMADPRRVIAVLERLRKIGLELAIDDFGTGYSSLAYLADLPVDTLKIDRSFVRRLVTEERQATIVRATIDLAHKLGLLVIAEGVEDRATWSVLKDMGCDAAQGFLIAAPMAREALGRWLEQAAA